MPKSFNVVCQLCGIIFYKDAAGRHFKMDSVYKVV